MARNSAIAINISTTSDLEIHDFPNNEPTDDLAYGSSVDHVAPDINCQHAVEISLVDDQHETGDTNRHKRQNEGCNAAVRAGCFHLPPQPKTLTDNVGKLCK